MSATAELQRILATPPPNFAGNPQNQAAVGHAALEALRDAGDPQYLFLRTVLELQQQQQQSQQQQPSSEELLFHCITGTRHIILSRWIQLSPTFRSYIRDLFFAFGQYKQQSRTIRLAYYNVSASLWKRHWNDPKFDARTHSTTTATTGTMLLTPQQQAIIALQQIPTFATFRDLFQYIDAHFIKIDDVPFTLQGASFLSILVGEFAGKSSYRLPLEFHKRAHHAFESQGWLELALKWGMKAMGHVIRAQVDESVQTTVVQLLIDVLSWEFGNDAFDARTTTMNSTKSSLLRPPASWRQTVMDYWFGKACFSAHATAAVKPQQQKYAHALRQMFLLLTSISGPVHETERDRQIYGESMMEGTVEILSSILQQPEATASTASTIWMDTISLITRLIANFQLRGLLSADADMFQSLLRGMSTMLRRLLQDQRTDCESAGGDLESMEHREWREEAIRVLLEGIVLLCDDSWLWYSTSADQDKRQAALRMLASTFGPLYTEFIVTRTRMARLEEHYLTQHGEELDEVQEEIFAVDLEDEMASLGSMGRLDLTSSLACLSGHLATLVPQLQALWETLNATITPEVAGLLEEARLMVMYIGHLLTDDNSGETPVIPDAIVIACAANATITQSVSQSVQALVQLAEMQASKIAIHPSDPKLSPLLGKTFLWFLQRWAPAYIMPIGAGESGSSIGQPQNTILQVWSTQESVQQAVSFCSTLCLHYHCYWPHEGQVQESSAKLLFSIAKRCKPMRMAMLNSPSFMQLLSLHCLTAGVRHSAPPQELEDTVRAKLGNISSATNNNNASAIPPVQMIRGYQRLPYTTKSRILTALLVACGDHDEERSKALVNDCFRALHDSFSSLVDALSTKRADPDSVDAREMACLCAELYVGIARAGDMEASERISNFLTPSLPHLSGLMTYYAKDLSICETLLRLFCDYAEQFIAVLETKACIVLFQTSAELLKSYSSHHCQARVVTVTPEHSADEEQQYSDILCAIQLLIQLGAKDFIDVGSGIESSQIADMIFFGLQQILPLMSQGLLQFPTLCSQYFSLVGFVMETYTDKLKQLPYELFDALLDSLLFGMSHHDAMVAKSSLQGLTGMLRDHLSTKSLDQHLTAHPELLDKCIQRFLLEVVFSGAVWDRLESAGMLLLPLAAIDLQRFGVAVQALTQRQQVPAEQQHRLTEAFQKLLQQEMVQKVTSRGYEGRQTRIKFKKMFEDFCHEIHSFLVLK